MMIVIGLMARRVTRDWMSRDLYHWVPNLSNYCVQKVSQLLEFNTYVNTYLNSVESDTFGWYWFWIKIYHHSQWE